MIESMLKHIVMMKIAMKYQILENLDFDEKEPKTSGFIDFRFQIFKFSMLTHVCGVARGFSLHGAKHSL